MIKNVLILPPTWENMTEAKQSDSDQAEEQN